MDRTVYDKLESNTASLKGVLDDYYLGRYEDRQAVKDLTERLFQLAHGYDPAAMLAACEAAYPLLIQNRNYLEAIELAEVGNCPACADYEGFGELCSNHRQQSELTAAIIMIEAAIARARGE